MSKLQQHTATKPETGNTSNLKQTHNKQHVTRNLKPATPSPLNTSAAETDYHHNPQMQPETRNP